jgi:hypothetical protein
MKALVALRMMQMQCTMFLCLAMLCIPISARAQVEAASPGDSLTIRKNVFQRLFNGITLTPPQRTEAERLIAAADRQNWAQMHVDINEGWEKLIQIQAQRDSALRTLLSNDADRGRFDANARTMRLAPRND